MNKNISVSLKAANDLVELSKRAKKRGELIKTQRALNEQLITKALEKDIKRYGK